MSSDKPPAGAGQSALFAPKRAPERKAEGKAGEAGESLAAESAADAVGWEKLVLGEDGMEIDPQELNEFMAPDLLEVKADPVFKERLRRKLWRLVRSRNRVSRDQRGE